MFSWCHAPCFHFPRVVFSGFVFHPLIWYVSCSVSHFIFSLLMFSFFSVRVACFQLSWFSFHFLFIVFLFSCFQFLENRISGNKMTSGSSKITPTWPPGGPKLLQWKPKDAPPEAESAPRETKRESSRTPKAKVAQIHCGRPIPYNCLNGPAPRPRPRGDYT